MPPIRNMPRRQPKQRRSIEMYGRILDAAARVFTQYGYARGTTNRIAEEAEISVGSLYQYFPDKEALLAELLRRHIRAGADEIEARLAHPDALTGSLEDRTRLFVTATVAIHRDDPRLHRVLFEEAPRPPDVVEELRAFEAATVSAIEAILAEDPEVDVKDIRMAAYITMTAIESITHRYASSHPDDADWETLIDQLVLLIVRYLMGVPR